METTQNQALEWLYWDYERSLKMADEFLDALGVEFEKQGLHYQKPQNTNYEISKKQDQND